MRYKAKLILHTVLTSVMLGGPTTAFFAESAQAETGYPQSIPDYQAPLHVTIPNLKTLPKAKNVAMVAQPKKLAAATPAFTGGDRPVTHKFMKYLDTKYPFHPEKSGEFVVNDEAKTNLPIATAVAPPSEPDEDTPHAPTLQADAQTPKADAPKESFFERAYTHIMDSVAAVAEPGDIEQVPSTAPAQELGELTINAVSADEQSFANPAMTPPQNSANDSAEQPASANSIMAQLQPTAGTDSTAAPANDMNTPMITLPEVDLPAAPKKGDDALPAIVSSAPEPKTHPAPVEENVQPAPEAAAPVKTDGKPAISQPALEPLIKMSTPDGETPAGATSLDALTAPPPPAASAVPSTLPDLKAPAKDAAADIATEKRTVAKAKKAADAEKKKAADEGDDSNEGGLSPASRAMIKKLKAPKDRDAFVAGKKIGVERGHDMQDLFPGNEGVSASSNPMGIKIEVKRPKFNSDYELEKAYNALSSGQSEAAIDIYKSILANDPNNTQALFGLATLYHRARQLDLARPLYTRLLTLDPNNRDGFNNFLVLLSDEAPNEALTELVKLEEKNPGFSPIPAQLSIIYEKLGDMDKATQKMIRAVQLSPENLTYRYNLAILMDKQKNYDEAAKLYAQLIEASQRGENIPGNITNIQQRLTFIRSNKP